MVEYPSLPFNKYREQTVVHHINLAVRVAALLLKRLFMPTPACTLLDKHTVCTLVQEPGLQLVNESPFIFAVS
eukprot:2024076-Prymnesium_polylepis.1